MPLDDPARVDALLDECIRRGLVEDVDGNVRATRAWKGWLQKAAEVLNRQIADTGFQPAGHPIALAVDKALTMKREDVPDADRADVVRVLTLVELSGMSEARRAQYGRYP